MDNKCKKHNNCLVQSASMAGTLLREGGFARAEALCLVPAVLPGAAAAAVVVGVGGVKPQSVLA